MKKLKILLQNQKIHYLLLEEYFITTARKERSFKLYFDFYSNAEEKSITSNDSINLNQEKFEEDE